MTKEVEIIIHICNQCSMACIFNTVLLDLTAAMTDSFEGRGLIRGGGGVIGGFTAITAAFPSISTSQIAPPPLGI